MLSPAIRAKRLRAEYTRVNDLHSKGGLITIDEFWGDPPDRYVIRYSCRGIARVFNDVPLYSDIHRVKLVLTASYPTTSPYMEWLTPIFHPNIRSNGQEVCIGSWYPAKTLDELVIMLGEMIQYKNYASHDPLYLEASLWAMQHKHLFPVDSRSLLDPNAAIPVQTRVARSEAAVDISILDWR